jgi:hypothetical protein
VTNRASNIGYPCLRFNVFERLRWQDKVLQTVDLQYRFEDGDLHERGVLRDLEDAGLKVYERQRDYYWPKLNISAHLDCKIVIEDWMLVVAPPEIRPLLVVGRTLPTDVKSCSRWSWEKINSVEDMRHSRMAYVQAYPGQLTMYNLFSEEQVGLFILKNKETGKLKEIWMPLDFEYAETLLKKAETINQHVATSTIPPPIPWDEDLCGRCAYGHICLNEAKREAIDLSDNPKLEEQLNRRAELAPLKKEYEQVDEAVKDLFKQSEATRAIVGEWLMSKHTSMREGKEQVRIKIDKLGIAKGANDE